MDELIRARICDSIGVKKKILENEALLEAIGKVAELIVGSFKKGGKVVICGNGGSASDSEHFCAELVGRFQRERISVPAIALNANTATMTAVANDYGYGNVYERQVRAYMQQNDILVGISTSGNSENVLNAAIAAKELDCITVGLLGKGGGRIADHVDFPLIVPSNNTARIQESHILMIHIICELVENSL